MAAVTWSPLRCYWLEARYELLRLMRTPSFVLPTLLFPAEQSLCFVKLTRICSAFSGSAAANRVPVQASPETGR